MFTHLIRAQRSAVRYARSRVLPFLGAAALLLGASGLAFAQAGTGAAGTGAAGTGAGSTSQSNPEVPGKVAPPSPSDSSSEGTGTHDGVITPKRDVDPDMSKKPPTTGTESMPVVKPKGTPGGAPGPQPK
jgi:hypothetical protein